MLSLRNVDEGKGKKNERERESEKLFFFFSNGLKSNKRGGRSVTC